MAVQYRSGSAPLSLEGRYKGVRGEGMGSLLVILSTHTETADADNAQSVILVETSKAGRIVTIRISSSTSHSRFNINN